MRLWKADLGALYLGDHRCRFRVWAPKAGSVEVELNGQTRVPLEAKRNGYWTAILDGVEPRTRYAYRLDGGDARPDPASRYQPDGVHGPSMVVDRAFDWGAGKRRDLFPLEKAIFYEIHIGTFTPEGTFDAAISRLDRLCDLGVTAVEIMPVAQFPGSRNWGYDGVLPFAVQNTYGGPDGLKRLVAACHARGLAVVLDVVYNHLGPEGNYFAEFGPYFTDRYKTPWGPAFNFDGPDCDPVRHYFLQNALHWIVEFHIDGLRFDAVHAIVDTSETPLLQEISLAINDHNGFAVAESGLNTLYFIRPYEHGGCDMDTQWTDDFHHSLHALLTGERDGYYQDFGSLRHMAKAMAGGFVYTGQRSRFRRRRHGVPAYVEAVKHVVCIQNHDQIGNRMQGERIASLVSFESLKLAAGAVLLSPFLPLLFMGEEWGETAPFLYFVSHSDEDLVQAVREGRKEEFSHIAWHGETPDPQSEETFERSRIDPSLREREPNARLYAFYKELIRLRKSRPALANLSKEDTQVEQHDPVLVVRRQDGNDEVVIALNFGEQTAKLPVRGRTLLDSAEERWGGPGGAAAGEIAGRSVMLLAQ
jgi:maltooligosyltrehalose trehalohydrolase